MSSPRWLIGLIMAFIMLCIVGNIIEGADMLTTEQVGYVQDMQELELLEAKDPGTGGLLTYGTSPKSVLDAIITAITMDWTWLYDIDPVTGEQTPNNYHTIWMIIYYPIAIGILFEIFVIALRFIRGF